MSKRNLIIISCCALLLGACAVKPPRHGNIGDQIEQTLKNAVRTNQSIGNNSNNRYRIPDFLDRAFIPKLQVGIDKTLPSERRFNIAVKDVPVRDFYMGLVKDTNYSMMVDPKITGTITLNLKNVTIHDVLDAVRDIYGYDYEHTTYGYKITPHQLETRIFTVNYLDMIRKGNSDTTISSGQISSKITNERNTVSSTTETGVKPVSNVNTESKTDFWKNLKETLEAIVGTKDGAQVILNPQGGLVVVKAYPETMKQVANYLDNLENIMDRQVIIEAEIIEVELNAQYQSGVDWKVLGLQQSGLTDSSTGGAQDFGDNLKSFTNIFTLKITKGGTFETLINLLNSQGKVNVLSSPRISTLNNQKALIKVGQDRFFVTDIESTTTTISGGGETSQDIEFTPFFSGIALDVTPQIAKDGSITLHIHPLVSKVEDETRKFTVNAKDSEVPLAKSSVRESDSVVHAQNGQVIVIGGLMENEQDNYQAGVPGLERAKGINPLFKRFNNQSSKRELIILLKPTIVNRNAWSNQLRKSLDFVRKAKDEFAYTY